MEIIEETHDRPEPRRRQHQEGFHSVVWGFAAIAVFMIAYYMLFGVISMIGLSVNLLLLIAGVLSIAAGHADAAGYRRYRARARYGDRRERADQRTRA